MVGINLIACIDDTGNKAERKLIFIGKIYTCDAGEIKQIRDILICSSQQNINDLKLNRIICRKILDSERIKLRLKLICISRIYIVEQIVNGLNKAFGQNNAGRLSLWTIDNNSRTTVRVCPYCASCKTVNA